ncbi:MAG: hypothetical protein HY694_00985 [Deltaproteobacteria bacterium]|nr:hypothetical protein [Deltaproteobacteria bacterium]
MNVYNRCFDDQNQLRIRLETAAIEGIFALAEAGRLRLLRRKLKVKAINRVEFIRSEGEKYGQS